jgi:hypothetical protein
MLSMAEFFLLVVLAAAISAVGPRTGPATSDMGLLRLVSEAQNPDNPSVSSRSSVGLGAALTPVEARELRARLTQVWFPSTDAADPKELTVTVRIKLKPDGTLSNAPYVLTGGKGETVKAARESAVRAIYRSQPFDMLSPANYEAWKELDITFNSHNFVRPDDR